MCLRTVLSKIPTVEVTESSTTKQLTHYTTPLKNTSSQSSRKVSFSLDGVRCMAFWRPLAARPKTRVCVCAKERERALIGFIVVIYYCECLL